MRFQIFKSPNDIFVSIKISSSKFAYFGQGGFVCLSSHPIIKTPWYGYFVCEPSVDLTNILLSGILQ